MKTLLGRDVYDWIGAGIVLAIALSLGTCTPAHAENISESKLLIAIAGEAGGCDLYEQEAIARAIINRNTLRGVYGYKSVSYDTLSLKTQENAYKALKRAYLKDITNGATHFLSDWDLKHCRRSLIAWRNSMKITLKTKHFTFYKEV